MANSDTTVSGLILEGNTVKEGTGNVMVFRGATVYFEGEFEIGKSDSIDINNDDYTGSLIVKAGASFVNNGSINIKGNVVIEGTFTNNGTVTVSDAGTLTVLKTGTLVNNGKLINNGTTDKSAQFISYGTVTSDSTGTIEG